MKLLCNRRRLHEIYRRKKKTTLYWGYLYNIRLKYALHYLTLKLPMEITIRIVFSNISNQDKIIINITPWYWNLSECNNEDYKWEDVFQDDHLIPSISTYLVIFDDVKVNLLIPRRWC